MRTVFIVFLVAVVHITGTRATCSKTNAEVSLIFNVEAIPSGCSAADWSVIDVNTEVKLKAYCECEGGVYQLLQDTDLPFTGECEGYNNIETAINIRKLCRKEGGEYCAPVFKKLENGNLPYPTAYADRDTFCTSCMLSGMEDFENREHALRCLEKNKVMCYEDLKALAQSKKDDPSKITNTSIFCTKGCYAPTMSQLDKIVSTDTYVHENFHKRENYQADYVLAETLCGSGNSLSAGLLYVSGISSALILYFGALLTSV